MSTTLGATLTLMSICGRAGADSLSLYLSLSLSLSLSLNLSRPLSLALSSPEDLTAVVNSNLLGSLLGIRAAVLAFRAQGGPPGHVWTMDGAGADGGATPLFAAYGATKAAVPQLVKSCQAELKAAGLDNRAQVHYLSPGLVTTDLLLAGADSRFARWMVNALAERPATVANELVPRIRAVAEATQGPSWHTKPSDGLADAGVGNSAEAGAPPPPSALAAAVSRALASLDPSSSSDREGGSSVPPADVRFLDKPTAYLKIIRKLTGHNERERDDLHIQEDGDGTRWSFDE